MSNWHVYIFLTTVWDEIIESERYILPSNRRAAQSADRVYTQIVGELPEEISTQAFKHFSNKRNGSKKPLDEWKQSVNFNQSVEI